MKISALKYPVICSALPSRVDVYDYPHLQDLEFAENFNNDGHDTIDVLIGSDYYWDIITNESFRADSGPTAVSSKFGWILSGPTSDLSSRGDNVSSHLCISGSPHSIESNDEIVSILRRFWETHSIGIENDHDVHQEKLIENEIVKPVFNDDDNHYEVGLPWKEDYLPSSNNYRLCETRLKTLHYKLKNESNLLSDYHQITKDREIKGVVERVDESNNPSSQSQTRVQSIPRLELPGTLLLARIVNKVNSKFKQLGTINWSDSTTALCWIKNERVWKQYVQHRVEEIRSLTHKDSWRHCPGELNPVDIPSRGQSAKILSVNSMWWNGPLFLQQPEEEWPKSQTVLEESDQVQCEVKKNVPEITHAMLNTSEEDPPTKVETIIGHMDINNAEIVCINSVQLSSFETEIRYLTRKKTKDG